MRFDDIFTAGQDITWRAVGLKTVFYACAATAAAIHYLYTNAPTTPEYWKARLIIVLIYLNPRLE